MNNSLRSFFVFLFFAAVASGLNAENRPEFKSIGYYKGLKTQPDTLYFKKIGEEKLRLLVMQPGKPDKKIKRPAMVWIYGGGWTSGSPEGYIPHLRYSAARGAVGIALQYRLVAKPGKSSDNKNTINDCIEDCADALQYLRKHAEELGIDPDKIIVIGDSAGGHLALCLGILNLPKNAKANVVINCNGISDMSGKPWINLVTPGPDQKKMADQVSPVNFLDARDAPILTMHGENDKVVLPADAEKFYQACKKAGIDTEYILWPGMRHAFILTNYTATEEQTTKAIFALDAFLQKRGFLK
ncbi:MAG: alpha/beta hydrolase [Bacteroidales bacterium]|nr:alpha/beta hydrolase [Bacteroidales bacterium]